MNEHLERRQRRRELLITISFSIFSILMIVVSAALNWPIFYIPLLIVEVVFVWWCYSKDFRSYQFRAFIVAILICLNVFLYGIHGEDFFVLIPTLCVEFMLLSLYEMIRIMDIAIFQSILLFLFHIIIKGYTFPTVRNERDHIILQMLSFVVLIVLCIYRIHHHRQEENDMDNMEEMVTKEQKIRNDFVANTSHELRTPVNTISGMCEIMLQKNLPDDIHSSVLDIQMTGVELQNIVTDIMDYAALEADTMVLSPRVYNITSTINDVMNMTVFENKEKQLEIIFDCDPTIPCQLEGDEQQLRRVLNSLIGNAIKFTNEGGITVSISHRPEAYGINLIVSVKDTGVGLSIEEQELIMQGFYQSDSDRSRKNSGMGLGLPITSALIKKMGGFLTIKSESGVGSEFSFAIPQKVLSDEPCISLQHPGAIKLIWYYNTQSPIPSMRDAFADHIQHFSDYFGLVSHRATSLEECKRRVSQGQATHIILGHAEYMQDKAYFDELSKKTHVIMVADRSSVLNTGSRIHVLYKPYNALMLAEIFNGEELMATAVRKKELKKFIAPTAKILVVDDNLMNLKVVEGLLRKYRIKVVAATSGEEAISMINSQDYDFVFMDHMMPGMDGVECFHHIRNKHGSYFAQVPIIALTANAIAGSREMFLAEGFNEFVAKPIDTALLNEILYRFIPLEKQLTEEDLKHIMDDDTVTIAPDGSAKSGSGSEEPSDEAVTDSVAPITKADPNDPFEALPGIDKETALTYCGSTEDFMELAEVYLKSGKKYVTDLKTAFETKDLKTYGLVSHTIKGTSKTLGILNLSNIALDQEKAAKAGNEKTVSDNHNSFILEYKKILDMFSSYFGSTPDEVTEDEPTVAMEEIEDWESLKAQLIHCLESFECRSFEDKLKEFKGKTINGKPIEEVLIGVLEKAQGFDFEGAIAGLDEIGGAS